MDRFKSIIGLIFAFGGFELTSRLVDRLHLPNDGLWPHVWKWVPALSLVGFVRYVEDKPLASIGWHRSSLRQFTIRTVVSVIALLGANIVAEPLWSRLGDSNDELLEGLGSFATFSLPEQLFIALTAGVTEEIMYRGYAMERLTELTDSSLVAGIISGTVFTSVHLRSELWSRSATLRMTQPTALLTACYLRFRALPVVIAAHALNDAVGFLLADRYADGDE